MAVQGGVMHSVLRRQAQDHFADMVSRINPMETPLLSYCAKRPTHSHEGCQIFSKYFSCNRPDDLEYLSLTRGVELRRDIEICAILNGAPKVEYAPNPARYMGGLSHYVPHVPLPKRVTQTALARLHAATAFKADMLLLGHGHAGRFLKGLTKDEKKFGRFSYKIDVAGRMLDAVHCPALDYPVARPIAAALVNTRDLAFEYLRELQWDDLTGAGNQCSRMVLAELRLLVGNPGDHLIVDAP